MFFDLTKWFGCTSVMLNSLHASGVNEQMALFVLSLCSAFDNLGFFSSSTAPRFLIVVPDTLDVSALAVNARVGDAFEDLVGDAFEGLAGDVVADLVGDVVADLVGDVGMAMSCPKRESVFL